MFAIDVWRRRARRQPPEPWPLLLIRREGPRRVVAHACERAREAGVVPGMTLGDARAILPVGARIGPETPEKDAAALYALALWARRFTPSVAVDPPGGLLLDVTGCERVWRGEERLLRVLRKSMDGLGIRAEAAIAPTFGAAWAMARFGEPGQRIIKGGSVRQALSPLPTAALRLEPGALESLESLGIERIGDVLALPRNTLPARFGQSVLLRLDQAMGEAIETIDPVRTMDPPRAERVFDGPTPRWDAIERTVRDLLAYLAEQLRQREQGALRVVVELARSDLDPARIAATFSRPTRAPKHLCSILLPRLERTHLGFGVEGITITAPRTTRLPHLQQEHWRNENAPPPTAASELLDTLTARLGPDRVVRAARCESHVPERAVRYDPALHAARDVQARPAAGDRPTIVFDPPREVHATSLTPDGPVLSLARGGSEHRIETSIGPERIGPEWWEGDRETRDYFKLQDDHGLWLWVFRQNTSRRWFVHGVWA